MSIIRSTIPDFIKPYLRLLRYGNERRKFLREISIRKKQEELLVKKYDAKAKKLVIFAIPGADWRTGEDQISGGIISIVSLCEETAKLQNVHGAQTIMCTLPEQHLLLRHKQFFNQTDVFRFSQLSLFFKEVEEIILHLPEYLCDYFLKHTPARQMQWLKRNKLLHINILNQSVLLMPGNEVIEQLKLLADIVTTTTAHQKYCTLQQRNAYGIPVHKFSVWISPEKYKFVNYDKKENLIVISPDEHPLKQLVLDKLKDINGLKYQIIQKLTYEQYKETIARAKWTLTFGEGLDGYLIEPVFSGAIGFSVYNEFFFTKDFEILDTLYKSYEEMANKIVEDIKRIDDHSTFDKVQREQFTLLANYYSGDEYQKNIINFYKGNYTFR